MIQRPFEDFISIIDTELRKRASKWTLSSIAFMDFQDVSQIIRFHIYKKWDYYDQSKPIQPWLNIIITNQIRNLIRNYYSNYSRPCLKCGAALDPDGCKIYETQCSDCPLYGIWMKRKQPASQIKIPVSIENHTDEVYNMQDNSGDLLRHASALHAKMKEVLKPIEWKVYEGLFIRGLEERVVAKKVGYITNEKGRHPGYKQIKNIRKIIITKVKKCFADGDIDL